MARLYILIALILISPLTWFGYTYSRDATIAGMIEASKQDNVDAFASYVDWEGLRAQLKQDLTAQKKSPIGASFGPEASKINDVVDYYVLPENIAIAFYYHAEVFENLPEENFILSKGYAPPFGFQITLGYPQNVSGGGAEIAAARQRIKAKFVFGLDGLSWKIKEMHVPIFMVPRHVYSTPAVRVYGPPNTSSGR
jgi:hypothetical protein